MLETETLESPRFSLCLFHSVLAVRYQRYQCCFQSTAYDTWSSWDRICVERWATYWTEPSEGFL